MGSAARSLSARDDWRVHGRFFHCRRNRPPSLADAQWGFFRGRNEPDKELLTISAPPDFRLLAPGKSLKTTREGANTTSRYLIDPNNDYLPYVVAGRYQESVVSAVRGKVQFWTFHPMDAAAAQPAADRISSSMKAFTDFFGPSPNGKSSPVRIVESPAALSAEFSVLEDPGGVSFPDGVLLDARAFQQGFASEAVLQLTEYELARTWFGWRVRPRPEAQILMGRGMGLFGLVIAAEARGQDQRRAMIESLINRYDAARAAAPDRGLMEPPAGYSHDERISTGYRAALFIVALEDLCGRDNLRAALREIIHDREGSDTGYEELRAATESESGKDLAQMFRSWLNKPGIPDDFRARYGLRRETSPAN
jgi:aminopeptidase N